jgi:hypothetical protein
VRCSLVVLLGCSPPAEPPGAGHDPTDPGTPPGDTGPLSDPGDSATDGTLPTDTAVVDCSAPLPAVAPVAEIGIATEEDFDFDLRGFVIYQQGSDLVGEQPGGVFEVISPGVANDLRGIQTLSTGNIVAAANTEGSLRFVNRDTGASNLLVGGLSSPNGVEVGPDDTVFFTESSGGRLRWVNPLTGDSGQIDGDLDFPNGVAFAPDALTLYATSSGLSGTAVVAYTWDGTTWGGRHVVVESFAELFDSIETDVCGNLYVLSYTNGKVFRISADGATSVLVADLPGGAFSAIKWGNGVDIWSTSTLYATNRSKIYGMDMGIDGTPDVLPVP